ncbi:hypothetical protein BGZ60DRAFT_235066 [Tricladium varicosporioides]|nr:hypothetical protein BGZ60DRAFT_235066 [Hymenoscyphus varicosporioides]
MWFLHREIKVRSFVAEPLDLALAFISNHRYKFFFIGCVNSQINPSTHTVWYNLRARFVISAYSLLTYHN